MSQKSSEAMLLFQDGYVCSQAVLGAFSEQYGLDRNLAFKLANGFGGGIARKQEICGAVSGAIMLIGLKYGKANAEDSAAHEKTYEKVLAFRSQFVERNGSINCHELLGCDMATAREKGLFASLCKKFVADAAEIAEEILSEGL